MGLVIRHFSLYLLAAMAVLFPLVYYLKALQERGRRTSASKTPPRSESPKDKKDSSLPALALADYKDILPPSIRENLVKVARKIAQTATVNPVVNEAEVCKNLIPFETDYRICGPSTYTPIGVSSEEIKSLGDFPDYASLSGVPLPNKYDGFQIDKAIARPYRPFRWAYHQTMCKPTPKNLSHKC